MINWFGPVSLLGYGVHSTSMIKSFVDTGVDVNLTPIGGIQEDIYYKSAWTKANKNLMNFDKNSPSVFCFHSEHATQFTGSPMVMFAIFETTKLHPRSIYNLKNIADIVFTTTERHKQILVNEGVPIAKIHVVHEGVDPVLYNTKECIKYIDTGKFTYITVGKWEKRKNTDMIIGSFLDTMQYKECALIAHTYNPFAQNMGMKNPWTQVDLGSYGMKEIKDTQDYVLVSNGMCDVYLTKPGISTLKMRSLYRSANVGIYYSHAEGWYLPLIETLACGVPCIASNVIGPSEYLNGAPTVQSDLVISPIGEEIANDGYWFKGKSGTWSTLSKSDLCDTIEDVYDDKDKYSAPDASLAKHYHDNFNWSLATNKVVDILG